MTMMTPSMSSLPRELVEEIVSRVPSNSTRAVRLTCKKWNEFFKSRSFMKMRIAKEEEGAREIGETRKIVMIDYNVYLMSIIINEDPSTKLLGKLRCLPEQVKISQIFHCEGLLLCILKDDDTKIVVWNPSLGQTRWIQTRKYCGASRYRGQEYYKYAFGFSENRFCRRSPKILRFIDDFRIYNENPSSWFEIYDFDSDSWTTLDISPHWPIMSNHVLSIKGNTYWGVAGRKTYAPIGHIICFDFTRERFGPLLPLPIKPWSAQCVSLSSVKEEKITALFQRSETYNKLEIWITTKIEANDVSWINLFTIDTSSIEMFSFKSFFIDEKKKVAVVFGRERETRFDLTHGLTHGLTHYIINVISEAGCCKTLVLGEPEDIQCWPLVCSYVPSTVQIKQHEGGKRKEQSY
ncbi:peroxiredoxin-2A [Capsella rubella]|nr:peroxiredoxin-2A [Capsella rubella]